MDQPDPPKPPSWTGADVLKAFLSGDEAQILAILQTSTIKITIDTNSFKSNTPSQDAPSSRENRGNFTIEHIGSTVYFNYLPQEDRYQYIDELA